GGATMKKRYVALLAVVLAAVAFAVVSYRWTFTPYGRMDYRAALSTHLPLPSVTIHPAPTSMFAMRIPLNLFFVVTPILPVESVHAVKDVSIPGKSVNVPARIYWPNDE